MLSDAFQFLFCIQNPAGMRNECGCDQLKQLQASCLSKDLSTAANEWVRLRERARETDSEELLECTLLKRGWRERKV